MSASLRKKWWGRDFPGLKKHVDTVRKSLRHFHSLVGRIRGLDFTGTHSDEHILMAAVYVLNGGSCTRSALAPIVYNKPGAPPPGKYFLLPVYDSVSVAPNLRHLLEANMEAHTAPRSASETGTGSASTTPRRTAGGVEIASPEDVVDGRGRTAGKQKIKRLKGKETAQEGIVQKIAEQAGKFF